MLLDLLSNGSDSVRLHSFAGMHQVLHKLKRVIIEAATMHIVHTH